MQHHPSDIQCKTSSAFLFERKPRKNGQPALAKLYAHSDFCFFPYSYFWFFYFRFPSHFHLFFLTFDFRQCKLNIIVRLFSGSSFVFFFSFTKEPRKDCPFSTQSFFFRWHLDLVDCVVASDARALPEVRRVFSLSKTSKSCGSYMLFNRTRMKVTRPRFERV